VVRLHLVDTANTRIFNFGISGAPMKAVGGDSGRVEREEFIDEILLSPSERAIVDVLFEEPGEVILELDVPPADASTYLKAMDRKRWAFPLVGVAAARRGG